MEHSLVYIFKRQIILSLLTMLLLILPSAQLLHRKNKTPEMKILLRMYVLDIVLCSASILSCVYLLHIKMLSISLINILDFISNFFIDVIPLTLVVHWLVFVEYTLHQSIDIIRRRYSHIIIPFYVGVAFTILSGILAIPEPETNFTASISALLYRLGLLIWCFYILASYVVLFTEYTRKRIPEYIRITPTVVSIVLGLILTITTPYLVDATGYAIGLMFADYYMFRRLGYIDQKTGFYNERYLPVLKKEAERRGFRDATVIRFKTEGNRDKLAGILRFWEPENCKIIVKDDGEFLVISKLQKTNLVERFIDLVRGNCESEGVEVETSFEHIK